MVRTVHKLFKLSNNRTVNALPKPYIDYLERSMEPRERVHDQAPETKYLDYDQDHDTGYVYRVPDQPIPVVRPPNSEKGLWGGLGMVQGFHKPKRLRPRAARVWFALIEKHTFYSDILDTHINIEVTERTLQLIDEHQGLDFYILNTSDQDLASELGRRLKYKMQLALATDTRDYIKAKYKDHIKPLEEVQWHGLKINEAISKFRLMRVDETIQPPLRLTYAKQLIERLKNERDAQKEKQAN